MIVPTNMAETVGATATICPTIGTGQKPTARAISMIMVVAIAIKIITIKSNKMEIN